MIQYNLIQCITSSMVLKTQSVSSAAQARVAGVDGVSCRMASRTARRHQTFFRCPWLVYGLRQKMYTGKPHLMTNKKGWVSCRSIFQSNPLVECLQVDSTPRRSCARVFKATITRPCPVELNLTLTEIQGICRLIADCFCMIYSQLFSWWCLFF